MQKKKFNKKKLIRSLIILSAFIIFMAYIIVMALNSDKNPISKNSPNPTQTIQPTATQAQTSAPAQTSEPVQTPLQSETPVASETPTATPTETAKSENLTIRTDYEAFLPNEAGEIPIVMFHNFIEAYEEKTEKEFTTTFAEFEALLETLYNDGYRLISMEDFIDCNISVPAGTKPMVFTFDDGSPGQFNLIEENGTLKVNPKSAAGIMMAYNQKHPDFGLRGIFYVNMDIGDNTFKGAGTLKERFEILQGLGLELGTHTWGHVDYTEINTATKVQESLGKNQEKAEEILPGLRFYSLALPYGSIPTDKSLTKYLQSGEYNGTLYNNESIMAVGADPAFPPIHTKYDSLYVRRVRAQGRVEVPGDLTWWLPRMTSTRMFISDGDPTTIVVPEAKSGEINKENINDKTLITY